MSWKYTYNGNQENNTLFNLDGLQKAEILILKNIKMAIFWKFFSIKLSAVIFIQL